MAQQSAAVLPTRDTEPSTILVVGRTLNARTLKWLDTAREPGSTLVLLPLLTVEPDMEEGVPISDAAALEALDGSRFGIWLPDSETSGGRSQRRPPSYAKLGRVVTAAIAELRPKHVHATDIGVAGLAIAAALRKRKATFPTLSVSNWHGDLGWYTGLPQHHAALLQLMELATLFAPEGTDDARIALQLGFAGRFAEKAPFPAPEDTSIGTPPSQRRDVVIDCRHAIPLGGGHLLSAAVLAITSLRSRRVCVVAEDSNIGPMPDQLTALGLDAEVVPAPADEAASCAMLASARLFVGARVSDVSGLNLFAAMQTGAFPIMTDASNAATWVRAGEDALIESHHDIAATARAIDRALADDALVDAAAARNASVMSRSAKRNLRDHIRRHYADEPERSEGLRCA